MSNLQILSNSIRTFENLYSLNDLHFASGNDPKHRPSLFARNEQTKSLVAEIENERSTKTIFALKTIRGGADIEKQGTWGCKEIVIAYAAWISPQFHLVVLRAFLNQLEQQPKQLALPQPEKKFTIELTEGEMMDLAWVWFAYVRSVHAFREIQQPLKSLGSKFSPIVYGLAYEYTVTAKNAHRVINRITKDIPFDTESNWRVLKHVRNFDPTFKESIL